MTSDKKRLVNEELHDYLTESYSMERFYSKFDENESNWLKAVNGNGRNIKPVYFVLMEREKRIVELESIMKKRLKGGDVDKIIEAINENQQSKLALENAELKKQVAKLEPVKRMVSEMGYKAAAIEDYLNR